MSTVCESSVSAACLHPGLLASDASDHHDACVALCRKQQLFDVVLLSILLSVLGMPLTVSASYLCSEFAPRMLTRLQWYL